MYSSSITLSVLRVSNGIDILLSWKSCHILYDLGGGYWRQSLSAELWAIPWDLHHERRSCTSVISDDTTLVASKKWSAFSLLLLQNFYKSSIRVAKLFHFKFKDYVSFPPKLTSRLLCGYLQVSIPLHDTYLKTCVVIFKSSAIILFFYSPACRLTSPNLQSSDLHRKETLGSGVCKFLNNVLE